MLQIRAELVYNNIRLYPFDTDETDEEEIQLNETIRVCVFLIMALYDAPDGWAECDSFCRCGV